MDSSKQRQGVLLAITPQVNDHNKLLDKEHWRAAEYYKTLLESNHYEVTQCIEKEVIFHQKIWVWERLQAWCLSQASESTQCLCNKGGFYFQYFLATPVTNWAKICTGLLFYAYVEIHWMRILVFDYYQKLTPPLKSSCTDAITEETEINYQARELNLPTNTTRQLRGPERVKVQGRQEKKRWVNRYSSWHSVQYWSEIAVTIFKPNTTIQPKQMLIRWKWGFFPRKVH